MTANTDLIEIELLPEERNLILEYGYPFKAEEKQLKAASSSDDIVVLKISDFYLNQMIGDLSYSINKRTKGRIQSDLFDLCERLESIYRHGEGKLEHWYF